MLQRRNMKILPEMMLFLTSFCPLTFAYFIYFIPLFNQVAITSHPQSLPSPTGNPHPHPHNPSPTHRVLLAGKHESLLWLSGWSWVKQSDWQSMRTRSRLTHWISSLIKYLHVPTDCTQRYPTKTTQTCSSKVENVINCFQGRLSFSGGSSS